MIKMHKVWFCDQCNEIINDDYDIEEKVIYFLNLSQMERMIFCCEECRDEYIKEFLSEGYITPSGAIYED